MVSFQVVKLDGSGETTGENRVSISGLDKQIFSQGLRQDVVLSCLFVDEIDQLGSLSGHSVCGIILHTIFQTVGHLEGLKGTG